MTDDDRLRSGALSDGQVEQFIRDGFIRIDHVSRIRTIPAIPAGTSIAAFPVTTAIPKNSTIFPLGA
jgi:hypothetical protein